MEAVKRALRPQMAILAIVSFVVVWLLGGPTRPWELSEMQAYLFLIVLTWVPVVLLAFWRKTLSMENSAFIFGFPILSAMVSTSISRNGAGSWVESWWFIALCLTAGFLIGIVLLEYELNWKQDKMFVVMPSDAWYLGQVVFMFYWAPRAAIMLLTDSWKSAVIAIVFAALFGVAAAHQDWARKQRISAGLTR